MIQVATNDGLHELDADMLAVDLSHGHLYITRTTRNDGEEQVATYAAGQWHWVRKIDDRHSHGEVNTSAVPEPVDLTLKNGHRLIIHAEPGVITYNGEDYYRQGFPTVREWTDRRRANTEPDDGR